EPLRVVNDAEHGAALCKLRKEREAAGKNEKALARDAGLEPKSDTKRGRLRPGKPVDPPNSGADQLMETGERELRFGLDRTRRQDFHITDPFARVVQQRRLADPRLAAHYQGATPRLTCSLQQSSDPVALSVPPVQHPVIVRPGSLAR